MQDALHRDGLTPTTRRLLELIERIGFGRIENLWVRSGEPSFDPPPRVLRDLRLKPGPSAPATNRPGELKDQFVQLMRLLRQLGDGVVELIEVQNSLPFRVVLEEPQLPTSAPSPTTQQRKHSR
ncbi:MAG: hypothetical protein R3E97_24835 [Candidatus Eisenbacteria bacterium]